MPRVCFPACAASAIESGRNGGFWIWLGAYMQAEEDRSLFWAFLEKATLLAEPAEASKCWAHIVNTTTSVLEPGVAQVVA